MALIKSEAMQPTEENLLSALEKNLLDRNKELGFFVSFLNQIDGNFSIGMDGAWGSGKTFFVKQAKLILDCYNAFSKVYTEEKAKKIKEAISSSLGDYIDMNELRPQISVYYDAWLNDNTAHPLLSLIYSIVQTIPTDYRFTTPTYDSDNIASVVKKITDMFMPKSVKNWSDLILDAVKIPLNSKNCDPLLPIQNEQSLQENISTFLDQLLEERGDRLVIFIDELDRCRPNFAVQLLEQIKHYFINDRITFVFSINSKELQHTIKQVYGTGFDACRYLDRFFDNRYTLPPADYSKLYEITEMNTPFDYAAICRLVIEAYGLTLREAIRYADAIRIAAYRPLHSVLNPYNPNYRNSRSKQLIICVITPILFALRTVDMNQYQAFINGDNSEPLRRVFRSMRQIPSILNELLEPEEAFLEAGDPDESIAVMVEKLELLYRSIFSSGPSNTDDQPLRIGNVEFTKKEAKDLVFHVESSLSEYANYTSE